MTLEVIFAGVTAVITALLGMFFKNSVVPARFIPVQNLVIGVVMAVLAVVFKIYDNTVLAVVISIFTAFGVGGMYDLAQTSKKK